MNCEFQTAKVGDVAQSVSETHRRSKEQLVFLNTSDILHGQFLHRTYSAVKGWPGQAKKSIRQDDILFSEIRPANGRWAYVDEAADDFVVSTKLMVIRSKPDRVHPRYLYKFLTSPKVAGWLQHLAESRSGTFPQITFDQVAALEIPLPSLAEQKAIAAVLGTLDDKIELNRRMNSTLEAMARTLFQSWFVDFDPVRAKAEGRPPAGLDEPTAALFPARFQDSELGEIPSGWRIGTLGRVAKNLRCGVGADEIEEETPYIGLEHMPRHSIALSDWGTAEALESNKSEFRRGEILFGKLRPYFHKVGVAPLDGVCSTDILVISTSEPDWFGFVLGHISSVELVNHTDAMSTGTKMPRTKWQDIADFQVVLPPPEIAAAYTELVDPLVRKIVANVHQSRTLATLRDTLLPKLLSGKLLVAQ